MLKGYNILFTDEASFTRDGINNSRNVHMWSDENPHETRITHCQRRFSVNVWCGVLGNRLIAPFVFDNILTGNTYGAFLRNDLPGLLEIYTVNAKEPDVLPTGWGSPTLHSSPEGVLK